MSIIISGFLPTLHLQPASRGSETRAPSSYSSSIFTTSKNHGQALFLGNTGRPMNTPTRRLVVRIVVEPGAPLPPPEPPVNFLNWIVGIAFTVVLPFFNSKWTSLLRIKNEVETRLQSVEDIAEAVEKVTERVEKAAEDIAQDLPEGGRFRRAVDFVEHIAERANRDAHIIDDFIDKVQEVEVEVEEFVEEAITNHKHDHKEDHKDITGQDHKQAEPTQEEEGNIDDDITREDKQEGNIVETRDKHL